MNRINWKKKYNELSKDLASLTHGIFLLKDTSNESAWEVLQILSEKLGVILEKHDIAEYNGIQCASWSEANCWSWIPNQIPKEDDNDR